MSNFNYYTLAFKKYAEFEGRVNRREFWFFWLFNFVIMLLINILDGPSKFGPSMILQVYQLLCLLPALGLAVRRMHDVGKSAWFVLIPIYNLVLYCRDGERAVNKYGAESKAK